MICKFCGSRLPEGAAVCPGCGKENRMEGGNGFWDIVKRDPKEKTAVPEQALCQVPAEEKEEFFHRMAQQRAVLEKRMHRTLVGGAFCSILIVLLSMSTFLVLRRQDNHRMQKMLQEMESRQEEENTKHSEQLEQLIEMAASGRFALALEMNPDTGKASLVLKAVSEETEENSKQESNDQENSTQESSERETSDEKAAEKEDE